MKFMRAQIVGALLVFGGTAYAQDMITILNDSNQELKVVSAHKIFNRAMILAPGQKGTIKLSSFFTKMGAVEKLKFHQGGKKMYVMEVRFSGKDETISYSQVQAGNFRAEVNPKTNQKEVRFVVTPLAKAGKSAPKEEPKKEKKETKSKSQKSKAKGCGCCANCGTKKS